MEVMVESTVLVQAVHHLRLRKTVQKQNCMEVE